MQKIVPGLGKALLLFVFFGVLVFVFLLCISFYDARHADHDKLHNDFRLVIFDENGAFSWLTLNEFNQLKGPVPSLVSKEMVDEGQSDSACFSYKMVKENNGNFLVDTRWKDDDRTVWSRYSVVDNQVIPIKSRLYAFDYMGMAVVLAFLCTYFLYVFLKKVMLVKTNRSIK